MLKEKTRQLSQVTKNSIQVGFGYDSVAYKLLIQQINCAFR